MWRCMGGDVDMIRYALIFLCVALVAWLMSAPIVETF